MCHKNDLIPAKKQGVNATAGCVTLFAHIHFLNIKNLIAHMRTMGYWFVFKSIFSWQWDYAIWFFAACTKTTLVCYENLFLPSKTKSSMKTVDVDVNKKYSD